MHIGIIIGRLGGFDGVALETEKWIEVLRRLGHRVFILSGEIQGRNPDPERETLLPAISFFSPESVWSQKQAFFNPGTHAPELIERIHRQGTAISREILAWIGDQGIDLIISENASSLPSHLEMGFAIREALLQSGLPAITHDHDFAWERGERYQASNFEIRQFIEDLFPLRLPGTVHAVINSHARQTLRTRFSRDSVLVPNVMDFEKPFGVPDQKNAGLPERLGFEQEDILLFQCTRILRRKRIETAIDLLHRLEDGKIKLVITGDYTDDAGSAYFNELEEKIHSLGLTGSVRFAADLFHPAGRKDPRGKERYSLSDGYARASACTYFSANEGFGNVFLESVLARRPVFVNNYEPVFMPDIGSKGFRTVMLEHGILTDSAVQSISEILHQPSLAREIAEHNFETGKRYFSFDTLRDRLEQLIRLASRSSGQ